MGHPDFCNIMDMTPKSGLIWRKELAAKSLMQ